MTTASVAPRTARRPLAAGGVFLFFAFVCASPVASLAAPRVVVTVKPLHSLVAGVMAGVGTPDLIIRGGGSPHTYGLKPSEARLLENAQIIFWVGPSLEAFMIQPLAALGAQARLVTAMQLRGLSLLPGREGGAWDMPAGPAGNGHGHEGRAAAGSAAERGSTTHDAHVWLDPANARVITQEAAEILGRIDPGNRARYAANAAGVVARIGALDAELRAELAPVREIPFVVFHDAYHYFEQRYALRAVGAITVSAERKPGARRVQEIRDTIRRLEARCVFSEPQFSPAILATLLEGSSIRSGTLDPLGAELVPGPDAYFALMKQLGASLRECLRPR